MAPPACLTSKHGTNRHCAESLCPVISWKPPAKILINKDETQNRSRSNAIIIEARRWKAPCGQKRKKEKKKHTAVAATLEKSVKLKQMQATPFGSNAARRSAWALLLEREPRPRRRRFNLCPHTGTLAAGTAVSCPSQTQRLQPPAEAGGMGGKKIKEIEKKKALSVQQNTLVSPERLVGVKAKELFPFSFLIGFLSSLRPPSPAPLISNSLDFSHCGKGLTVLRLMKPDQSTPTSVPLNVIPVPRQINIADAFPSPSARHCEELCSNAFFYFLSPTSK